ncbi:MAG: flagellar biosynthetic protein FliR [Candidatus Marinimicrobia bacterium]|nr:flagellar biosynthetic protein FliR [Candidatus Neomarinimicrobiota bacterium]MCF7841145.1 flagellar biosynthetic protein FliR [Candidatus Neomarinimicrobiota bacterium]
MDLIQQYYQSIPQFMLIFARISAMLMTMPVLSASLIPNQVRILFAVVLSFVLVSILPEPNLGIIQPLALFLLVGREILFGMLIGVGANILFESFSMAGGLIARQLGMAIANVMDPSSQQQQPIYSQFWFLIMVSLLFVTNTHHMLVVTLYDNFNLLPLGQGAFPAAAGETVVRVMSKSLIYAVKLSLPAMIFLLLLDTAFAFLARVMPQMNVFFVTLPLKIGIGFIVMIISVDIFQSLFDSLFHEMYVYIGTMARQLGGV